MIELVEAFLQATVAAGTPYLLATLGEIMTERSGILNLGLEGLMIMGAVTGFGTAFITGNVWLGVLIAGIVGGIVASIHAIVSITLKANQTVSGLALTMFGLGLSGLLGKKFVGLPLPVKLQEIEIPLLSDLPLLGPLLFRHDFLTYLSIVLAIILWFVLFKTKAGIIIRSVGENPNAADSLGISVARTRYICTILGGVLVGLAGGYLSLKYTPAWSEGMTMGKGWIAVGLTILAMWQPIRAILGAYLFGGIAVLQYRLQPYGISSNLLAMLPYIATISALILVSGRMRRKIGAPAALGKPYIRGGK